MSEQFLERAIASAEVGDDTAARRWAARALAAAPDEDLRARILIHQAYHVGVSDSVDDGMAMLEQVGTTTDISDGVRARVHINRGLLLQRSGSRQALPAFDRALELLPAHDLDTRCTVHLNRGVVRMDSRDLSAARDDFEAALALARDTGSTPATAMASANLSYALMLAGELPAALRELEAVTPVLSELSPVLAAKCLANRAEVLLAAGLLDEAVVDLEQAARTFGRRRNTYEQAEAEHQLARVLLALGDLDRARRSAVSAARRYDSRGFAARAAQSRCLALQAQLAAGLRPGQVAARAGSVADWFEQQSLRHEARLARLLAAEALLELGRPDDARAAAGDALVLRRRDPVVDRLRVRRLRAALADATGRGDDAEAELGSAMRDLQHQVGLLGSLELRSAISVHAQEIAAMAVDRAVAGGDPRRVLAWAEATRALSSRPSPVTPPADPQVSGWLRELRQARAELPTDPGVPTPPALRERVRDLERRLRQRAWQHDGRAERVGAAPGSRLGAALDAAGGVMLALLGVRSTVLALVVGDGPPRMLELGPLSDAVARARTVRADLDLLAVRGTPPVIRQVARRSLEHGLATLTEQLLPLLDPEDRRPLLLAPTAALSLVPWGLLRPLRGRTVTVSGTGTSWLRRRGDSWFSPASAVEAVLGPGLQHGGPELEAVRAVWPGSTVRSGATAAQTLAAAGRADVLHVAAHGVHEPQSPLFSHLRMSDGPLFGHELYDLPRPPRHVLLSACEVGCAETRPGDERLGMTAALLAAGVGSVVAGVARVDDEVSARVAAGHHRGLAAGMAPAQALAEAVAALPDGSAPAPFVCFGSGW